MDHLSLHTLAVQYHCEVFSSGEGLDSRLWVWRCDCALVNHSITWLFWGCLETTGRICCDMWAAYGRFLKIHSDKQLWMVGSYLHLAISWSLDVYLPGITAIAVLLLASRSLSDPYNEHWRSPEPSCILCASAKFPDLPLHQILIHPALVLYADNPTVWYG